MSDPASTLTYGHFNGAALKVKIRADPGPGIATLLSLDTDHVGFSLFFDNAQLKQIGTTIADHLGLVMVEGSEND